MTYKVPSEIDYIDELIKKLSRWIRFESNHYMQLLKSGLTVHFYCSFDYKIEWKTNQRKAESVNKAE